MKFSFSSSRNATWTLLASSLVLALLGLGAEITACSSDSADVPEDSGSVPYDAGTVTDTSDPNITPNDASVNCTVNGVDPVDFCRQKAILQAEHAVFDPKAGIASSWNAMTLAPNTDGGVVLHDFHDDVAYAASLSIYLVSENEYNDTELDPIITTDLTALVLSSLAVVAWSISAATMSEAIASARRNPVVRMTTAAIAVAMKPNRSVRMCR